jgi:hypothetical protein
MAIFHELADAGLVERGEGVLLEDFVLRVGHEEASPCRHG